MDVYNDEKSKSINKLEQMFPGLQGKTVKSSWNPASSVSASASGTAKSAQAANGGNGIAGASAGGTNSWAAPSGTSVGIRGALNSMGFSNNQIGWDGEYVTLDGNRLYKPDALSDGVSYANSRADLSKALVDTYAKQGKNVVKVTDYLANSNLPFDVGYNNGMLSIGGIQAKPLYVDNNYAYMDSGELDRIISQAQKASGITNRQDIAQKYEEKYSPYYDKLLDAIANREAFSYDPESDPAYQAYRLQYNREGDRAARDAAGAMAGLTGGYANSAAATAAAQQSNYYAQQLTDKIPELLQQAYNRYVTDYDMKRQALSSVMGLDKQQFDRAYGVNDDIINDVRYNNQLKTARDDKAYERSIYDREYADSRADVEYGRRNDWALDPEIIKAAQLENDAAGIQNYGSNVNNVLTEANLVKWLAQQNGGADYGDLADWARKLYLNPVVSPYYSDQKALDMETAAQKDILAYQYANAPRSSGRSSSGGSSKSSTQKPVYGEPYEFEDSDTEEDENDIRNAHAGGANGWISVPGYGRLSWSEVSRYMDLGKIEKTTDKEGKIIYSKK